MTTRRLSALANAALRSPAKADLLVAAAARNRCASLLHRLLVVRPERVLLLGQRVIPSPTLVPQDSRGSSQHRQGAPQLCAIHQFPRPNSIKLRGIGLGPMRPNLVHYFHGNGNPSGNNSVSVDSSPSCLSKYAAVSDLKKVLN